MNSSIRQIHSLDELLAASLGKSVEVIKQDAKLLTAPGENYGSIMLALTATITDNQNHQETLNLVAKTIPINEMLKELFQVQISFVKELNVYVKIVPALRDLEMEHNIRVNRASDLFCKCYGGRNNLQGSNGANGIVDENAVILLENLKLSGYENGDRLHGFDYSTASTILKKLAVFHATPIALKILKPEVFDETIVATLSPTAQPLKMDTEKTDKFLSGLRNIISENTGTHSGFVEILITNVRKSLTESLYQKGDPKKPFVTFVHSDFWVNNMMISKTNNLKIVDFQTPILQSLVCDLLFFMYSSISADDLYANEDAFLRTYYEAFIDCLKAFNINNLQEYNWNAFISELKQNSAIVLNQIMFMYKVILMERGQIADMNEFKDDDLFNFDNVSENCKFRMRQTFESFINRGWL